MPTRVFEIPNVFVNVFNRPSRYKALYGGRGGGKTQQTAKALLGMGWMKPERILCGREIQKSIKDSVKQVLDDQISFLGMRDFYHSTESEITSETGTRFFFSGLKTNPDKVKGMEGITKVWVDEAQSISTRSLEILIPTIRKEHSELIFTWNPRNPTDPVDRMFRGEVTPPDSIIQKVNYYDNPFFPEVSMRDLEYDKRRDYDKYCHVWLGDYEKNSEARVFRNWRIESFDTPKDAMFLYGADWGFSIDPSVLIRIYIEKRTLYVDQEAYMVGCPIDQTPALFDTINDAHARKWVIRADSARPDTIDYMRKHGYPKIVPANKGPNSVMDGIEFLKSYDIVVNPRCIHTIDELTYYSFKTHPLTGDVLPILEDKKNHVIDALRYATEGVRKFSNDSIPAPIQVFVNA